MAVLLLRLAGPLQSWGTQSRFDYRDTGLEPSKSGVVGLLSCALGRGREQDVSDLAALRMGVRIDRPGYLETDYHTASKVRTVPKGGPGRVEYVPTVQSWRQYLADGSFLVGLEGEFSFLQTLDTALRAPVWPLSLGRKSFVPCEPIAMPRKSPLGPGVREGGLEEVLRTYPWIYGSKLLPSGLLLALEVPLSEAESSREDQPVGAAFSTRHFTSRGVRSSKISTAALDSSGTLFQTGGS